MIFCAKQRVAREIKNNRVNIAFRFRLELRFDTLWNMYDYQGQ